MIREKLPDRPEIITANMFKLNTLASTPYVAQMLDHYDYVYMLMSI